MLKPPRERSGQPRGNPPAPITVLLRIEFTASRCSHVMGELLPRLSTLTASCAGCFRIRQHFLSPHTVKAPIGAFAAVYLCCTFPEVAFGGRYPLSLPCGARTFLMNGLSTCSRDCLSYSPDYYTEGMEKCQPGNPDE